MTVEELLDGEDFYLLCAGTTRSCDITLEILAFLNTYGNEDQKVETAALLSLVPVPALHNSPITNEWWDTDTAQTVAERAWMLAEESAPNGWWFGTSPMDLADTGFWRAEDMDDEPE